MDPETVAEWCQTLNINTDHCLALLLPKEDFTTRQIYQLMDEVIPQGRCFIRGMKKDDATATTSVLLEWDCRVINLNAPPTVEFGKEGHKARLVFPTEGSPEGGSPTSTANEPPLAVSTTIGPDFITALGDFVEKCTKGSSPYNGIGYRKLRLFSGSQPVPTGEDDYESWMEQSMQVLDEWDIPEAHKKQRIAESLRGAAADTVRNLKLSKQDCTAYDYLQALQDVFGRTENAADLLYQFEHTYQGHGEKLSDYIQRLDKILHQILLKKGLDPKLVDKVRVKQILQGAQPLDPIMLKLRMKQGEETLTYNQLIKEVREEEARLEVKGSMVGASSGPKATVKTVCPMESSQEMTQMRGQLQMLTELMTQLTKSHLSTSGAASTMLNTTSARSDRPGPTPDNTFGNIVICYKCGEAGHYRARCRNKPNPDKVINQLSKLLNAERKKMQGNFREPQ
eukprot:XP_004911514.2 PREDICTED: paraneoplastic antigen Ma2-like [Xenopus tropicalis]